MTDCQRLIQAARLNLAGNPATCIASLAGGWINPPDLCPVCTQTFMRALGAVEPNLDWHQSYRDRAAGRVTS